MGIINQAINNNNSNNNNVANNSISALLNATLSRERYQKRFEELLGQRTPQFISSIVSLINADKNLQEAFRKSPESVIQIALKAAMYDLPIDQNLGYVYIIAFGGNAQLILGYKGMHQLALRTGAYKTINVVDIRDSELIKYNRLTEELEIEFFEDEDYRSNQKIIGYAGYYKMLNGTEKTIYMSMTQIENHEKNHRKGNYQNATWKNHKEAMCAKTVYKILIGKWGLLSIVDKNDNQALIAQSALNDDLMIENIEIVQPDNNNTGE